MTSHGDCTALWLRAMLLTFVVYKSCLVASCESAAWVAVGKPCRGCSETWLLCSLPLIFLPVFLLLCFFVDGVNTHLHYSLPGWPVLGKLTPALLNATFHQILLHQVIPAKLLTTWWRGRRLSWGSLEGLCYKCWGEPISLMVRWLVGSQRKLRWHPCHSWWHWQNALPISQAWLSQLWEGSHPRQWG